MIEKGIDMTKNYHHSDRFPYEAAYCVFKLRDGCLPETVEEYARKLSDFFEGLYSSNEVFHTTNDVTKITLEDLKLHFDSIRANYTAGTFNNIHIVLNQYYRFLIVELRLPVPPLTWAITTQKREQIPLVLQLPWEEMTRKVLEGNTPGDYKLAFLLFSKGWSIKKMLSAFAGRQLLHFEWSRAEQDFLTYYPRPLIGSEHLFLNRKGELISGKTLAKWLNKTFKTLDLTYKHGVLRDDARIMYIARHRLTGHDLEKLYGFVLEGRFSKTLLKLSEEIQREWHEKSTSSGAKRF